MERELFDWDGWDGDYECVTYYDVTLKQQIGDFPPGTKFDGATIENEQGVVEFYNNVGEVEVNVVAKFKLHYRVGERQR